MPPISTPWTQHEAISKSAKHTSTRFRLRTSELLADLAARQAEIDVQLADLATLREQLKNDEVKRAYEAQLAKQKQDEAKAAADRQSQATAELAVAAPDPTVAVAPVVARGEG